MLGKFNTLTSDSGKINDPDKIEITHLIEY